MFALLGAHAAPRPAWPPWPEPTLALYRFDDLEWRAYQRPPPLGFDAAQVVESWSEYSLVRDGLSVSPVAITTVDASGRRSLAGSHGAVRFWFSPHWSSVAQGGQGPGGYARLLELVSFGASQQPTRSSLYVGEGGEGIYFSGVEASGKLVDYLAAKVDFVQGEWQMITLCYGEKASQLWLDGELVAEGGAVPAPASWQEPSLGLIIGSDLAAGNPAYGQFEEVTTFDYWPDAEQQQFYFSGVSRQVFLGTVGSAEEEAVKEAVLTAAFPQMLLLESEGDGMQMAYSYSSNELWLEITDVANSVAYFVIHTPAAAPYDLFLTTNLTAQGPGLNLTNWLSVGGVLSGQTNVSHWIETNSIAFYRLGTTHDTDDDGLTDAFENLVYHTDPNDGDSDSDGMGDGCEVVFDTDPNDATSGLQVNGHAALLSTNGCVLRLTPSVTNRSGSAFLKTPIGLANGASFSTYFSFRIGNGGGSKDSSDEIRGADGIVFVVQTLTNSVGGSGGGMGYQGITNSVGIEFDTWNNSSYDPANDGNHVGIDFNGSVTSADTVHISIPMNTGSVWHAWVDYEGANTNLEVRLSADGDRPIEPTLSYTANLLDYLGTTNAYLGFTAGTGASHNEHDILSWQVNADYEPIGQPANQLPTVTLTNPVDGQFFLSSPTNILLQAVASDSDGAVTNVAFYEGTNWLGNSTSQSSGVYPWLWTNVAARSYTLTALAQDHLGASNWSAAIHITNNALPTVTIVSPTNGQTGFLEGTNVLLSASAADSDGAVTNVQFWSGTNLIGTATPDGAFSNLTWSGLSAGSYPITAVATDNHGASSASPLVVVIVDSTNVPPFVAITYPNTNDHFAAESDLTITAAATNGSGNITNVEFFINGARVGGDPYPPYSLEQCCWKPGHYKLEALATDDVGLQGLSLPVFITIDESVPRPDAGYWDPEFSYPGPGVSPWMLALASDDEGTLYVGGTFLWQINGVAAPGIARWDGVAWHSMIDVQHGIPLGSWDVRCIEPVSADVYVGGNFGESAPDLKNVARWDGTNWHGVGTNHLHTPFGIPVRTLAMVGGDLYAGGEFTQAGTNDTVQRIARFDALNDQWVSVGDGITNGTVYAIASVGEALYIGGSFTNAGANGDVHYLARLVDGVWSAVGGGVCGTNGTGGTVRAMAVCGQDLFVGGDFTVAGTLTNVGCIAIWDGKAWRSMGGSIGFGIEDPFSGTDRGILTISILGNDVFFGGEFTNVFHGTNVIDARYVAKATWNEASQTWAWADLDTGVYYGFPEEPFPQYYEAVFASEVVPGTASNTYDLFIGSACLSAGSGATPSYNMARYTVGRSYPPTAPGVTITNPASGTVFTNPASILIEAEAFAGDSNSPIWSVEFLTNGVALGEAIDSPYSFTWYPGNDYGIYKLTAIVEDEAGLRTISDPVLVNIIDSNSTVRVADDLHTVFMNSGQSVIPVLSNDWPVSDLRISAVTREQYHAGSITISHDQSSLNYTPNLDTYGTDIFSYTATNSFGVSARGYVTVKLRARPIVEILHPEDRARLSVSNSFDISGDSFDWDGTVTNIALYQGAALIAMTNAPAFAFAWSNGQAGYYTFEVTATDSHGYSTTSAPVTLILTNASSSQNEPEAVMANLSSSTQVDKGVEWLEYPVIREGLFELTGTANDADAGDAVAYKVLLFAPGDLNPSLPSQYWSTPVADVTPAGSQNAEGYVTNKVVQSSLGTLDLTTVPNGIYDLVLHVRGGTDATNAVVRVSLESALKIGQFSFSEQDLVIPVNGIPLTVVRTYNSLDAQRSTLNAQRDFGPGWTHVLNDMQVALSDERETILAGSVNMLYAEQMQDANGLPRYVSIRTGGSRDVTLTLPDGRRTTFAFKPRATSFRAHAEWEAAPGVFATLTPLGSEIINYFPWLQWADGGSASTYDHHDVPGWVLETPDGNQYVIERGEPNHVVYDPAGIGEHVNATVYDGPPKLTRIVQRTGDRIEISESGLFHYNATNALTRSILFERDSAGRITAIHDPISGSNGLPAVKYVYNRNTGNLIQVQRLQDREAGTYLTTKYRYDHPKFPHYITSIEDPRGVPLARNEYDDSGRLTAVVDADGQRTEFVHNTGGKTEIVIDRLNNTNTYAYDERGNVTALTNALSGITLLGYDENNNRTTEVQFLNGQPYATNTYQYLGNLLTFSLDALGHSNSFVYGVFDHVTEFTDARGFTSTNYYDQTTGLPVAFSDALGNTASNFFNGSGLLVGTHDPLGTRTTNYFDNLGNLIETATLDATGVILSTNTYAYDANGNVTNSISWRRVNGVWTGATNTMIYDTQNRVVQTIAPNGGTNTVAYNALGKQDHTVDALGRTNCFEYDAQGRLYRVIYPDDTFTLSGYDAEGRRIAETNQVGTVTCFGYDALGRLVTVTNAFGTAEESVTETIYDDLGRVRFSVDARGITNAFGYDLVGRRVAVTNAWGTGEAMVSRFGFDENGNGVTVTNGFGGAAQTVISNVFDPLNRQWQIRFADDTRISTALDAVGRRVAQTNQDNIVTCYGHDGVGRLVAVTNALGTAQQTVTRYEHDEAGNQTAQIDALERETSFEFDALGRRTRRTFPGNQSETFGYDLAGNLVAHTNFNGTVITNQYDGMNRLWKRWNEGKLLETYLYSATGRLTNRVDESGTHEWVYDARERMLTNSTPVGTLTHTWDANGNQLSLKSATTDGVDLSYEYDPLNRLTNVVDNQLTGTKTTGYTFDGVGNLASLKYPNGVDNCWQYDALNRLTNLMWKLNGAGRADFAYKLASAGNRTKLTETVDAISRVFTWQHDSLYRMTSEAVTGASPTGTLGYDYDDVGNRLSRSGSFGSLGSQTLAYSANDWLDNDSDPDNGSTYFDANGNTTGLDGTWQYDWANRLTNFNSGAATYVYDADGNRIKKTTGGVTTWYLVGTVNPSGWPQVMEEHTGGTPGTLSRRYTFGLDLISQSRWTGSAWNTHFYLADGLGSTRALLDSSGTITDTYVYDAYGTLTASSGSTPNDFLFAGEQWDAAIGQYYLRARTMHPGYGRFWTFDTHEGTPSVPLSLHKYVYAANNPVMMIDPSGHDGSYTTPGQLSVSGVMGNLATRVAYSVFKVMQYAGRFPRITKLVLGTQTIITWWGVTQNPEEAALYYETGGFAADIALLKSIYRDIRGVVAMYKGLNSARQAQGIAAILTKESIHGGTAVPRTGGHDPVGWNLLPETDRARGHLLANSLGGQGDVPENVVALYQSANRQMENYELEVLRAVEAGEKIEYAVVPIYQEGLLIPTAVSLHAQGDKGFNLSVTVLNGPKP